MSKLSALALFFALVFTGTAAARTCEVEITANDQIQFNQSKLTVSSECDKVKLTLKHVGKLSVEQMGHNWTLSKTEHWRDIAQQGQAAGPENEYLPAGDERILAHTDMIGGGETASVTFDLSSLEPGGDYTFFCSFPGHWALMNGKFVIE